MTEGKLYKTKFQTGEWFIIWQIEKVKGAIIRVWGFYPTSMHLGFCPLNTDRIII